MNDPLEVYLHDHLAGAAHAIDLVEYMSEEYAHKKLGRFASELLEDIREDRDVLNRLAQRVGGSSLGLKEIGAWVGAKVSRLKLTHDDASGLGLFEALEFVEVGIHGKLKLWRLLEKIARSDSRLAGIDFDLLAQRAETQGARVEGWRLRLAGKIFVTDAGDAKGTVEPDRSEVDTQESSIAKSVGTVTAIGALVALAALTVVEFAPAVKRYVRSRAT